MNFIRKKYIYENIYRDFLLITIFLTNFENVKNFIIKNLKKTSLLISYGLIFMIALREFNLG